MIHRESQLRAPQNALDADWRCVLACMPTMLSREDCVGKIVSYVRETHLANSAIELPMDTSLIEAGIIDSYALIDLVTFLESQFKIKIPDEDITKPNLGSIHKMADYIIKRKQATA